MLVVSPAAADIRAKAPAATVDAQRDRAETNRRVFDAVWNEVRNQYYDPRLHGVDWDEARRTHRPEALAATDDRALYRVLGRMLDLLDDDHAAVAAPAMARRTDALRQRRAAIGVVLRRDGDRDSYTVEAVRPNSPAEDAGVAEGWRLDTSAEGAWVPEMDVVEGRPVTLAFVDAEGEARPTLISPRMMEPQPAFTADRSRPGVMVLRVEGFEPGLGRWMGQQLTGLDPATDVVVDLRGNPGGRLAEADAVLSCFLPSNQAWATRTARSGRPVVLRTGGGCGALDAPVANPVAILVDSQSRSAAELTPAALQEARRAVVVGQPTAGAVLISQETRLPDGGRLTLSRANFVTTGGVRLEKRGVTPDVSAAATRDDRRRGVDPALDAAIAALSHAAPEVVTVRIEAQ